MSKKIIVQTDTFGEGFEKANDNFTELYTGYNDNVTTERIPYKSSTSFINSPLYFDVSENKIVSDVTFEVPGGTISVGETTNISSGSDKIIISDEIKSTNTIIVASEFDSTGSDLPIYPKMDAQAVLQIQNDFSETITTNPLTYSQTGTVVAPQKRQVNVMRFKTGAAMANTRIKFTDNATGLVVRYIPNKASWLAAADGIDFVSGDNTVDMVSVAADTPGVFNLGVNPFVVENGQQIDVEIQADSVSVLGLSGVPYQNADIQDFLDTSMVAYDANGSNVTVPGDVHVNGDVIVDGTITSSSTENLLVTDNHILLSNGYQTEVARMGGIIVNRLPTSTKDVITAGAFVAGVPATSNPTVTTVGAAVFSQNDIIMINATAENDGVYEVESHAANLLTIKGVGTVPVTEGLFNTQFTANASDSGTITKITATSVCTNDSGVLRMSDGSVTPLVWVDISTSARTVVTDDILTANFLVKGEGTTEIGLASPDGVSGARFDATNDSLIVRTPAASTGGYVIEDSAGDQKMCWAYSDSLDDLSADFEATTNSLVSTVGSLRFQSNAEDLTFETLAKDIIIESADMVNITGANGVHINKATVGFADGSTQSDGAPYYDMNWRVQDAELLYTTDVSAQITQIRGLHFSPDGFKMYLYDNSTTTIYEYDLAAPWDTSTAPTYTANSLNVATRTAITMRPDGTYIYGLNNGGDFSAWELITPWDLSTATPSTGGNTTEVGTTGLYINDNGIDIFFFLGTGYITHWQMSTPWNFTNITDTTKEFDTGHLAGSGGEIFFRKDGRSAIVGTSQTAVYEYSLDIPWDITTMKEGNSFAGARSEVFLNPVGDKMFTMLAFNTNLFEYSLGYEVPRLRTDELEYVKSESVIQDIEQLVVRPGQIGHIDTVGFVAQEDTSTPMNAPLLAIDLAPDGTKYFVCGNAPQIYRYDMTAPFDITTGSYFGDSTFNAGFSITGLSISPDGKNMITVQGPGIVRFWTMAVGYDFDNAVQGADVTPSELVGSWIGCDSSGDGRHFYLNEAGFVRHYTRNGWSDQSLTYQESFAIAGGGNTQTSAVSSDGRILYWNNSSVIREYTLTTQWDVSTAVLTEQINGVMNSLSRDIRVSPDGTKLYGGSTDTTYGAMNEYDLGLTVSAILIDGDSAVSTPDTLTANFLTLGGGAAGIKAATADDVAGLHAEADGSVLNIRAVADTAIGYTLKNSSGGFVAQFLYDDLNDQVDIFTEADTEFAATGAFDINATGILSLESSTNNVNITSNFEIDLTSNNGDIVLTTPNGSTNVSSDGNTDILSTANGRLDVRKDATGTDTFPILRLDNQLSSTNPGTVNMHVGDRDPNGAVTGTPNDLYFRQDGVDSDIYYSRAAGTAWNKVLVEGFNSITLPAGDALTIDGTYTTDTPVLILDNSSGTGGASVRLIPTTTNPQGTDTGQFGDIRIRKSGVDSTAYIHVDTITNDDWVDLGAGSVLMFGASNIGLTTTLRYMNPYDMFQTAPTSRIEMVAPRDGFLRNLHVYHGITGVGFNVTYTVYLNGTLVTALSVTMAVSDVLAKDTNGFIPVTESDRISVRAQMSNPATTSPSKISITMELV